MCHFFFFTLNLKTSSQNILHFGDGVYEVLEDAQLLDFWNVFVENAVVLAGDKNTNYGHFQNKMSALVPIKCKDICLRSDMKYKLFKFFSKISV